jgi:hypothetical protein
MILPQNTYFILGRFREDILPVVVAVVSNVGIAAAIFKLYGKEGKLVPRLSHAFHQTVISHWSSLLMQQPRLWAEAFSWLPSALLINAVQQPGFTGGIS